MILILRRLLLRASLTRALCDSAVTRIVYHNLRFPSHLLHSPTAVDFDLASVQLIQGPCVEHNNRNKESPCRVMFFVIIRQARSMGGPVV